VVFTVGERTSVSPTPLDIPPQETEYHFQDAPIPKLPPTTERLVGEPLQIIDGVEEPVLAGIELVHTETVTLAQAVVLQRPSPLT